MNIKLFLYRHNEDGSYTYGYEGSDGSFKIETKTHAGEVTGKYGYVDDLGKLRVVEYGANKYGFQPSGEGITVPSPTLIELRSDEDPDEEPPRLVKRPSSSLSPKPQKPLYRSRPAETDDGFVQQQPILNTVRPITTDFDDSEPAEWTVQSADRRPSATRVDGNRPTGERRGSSTRLKFAQPPVSGSFSAVPEEEQGPSGSYQTVQNFGSRSQPGSNGRLTPTKQSYQTFEDDREPATEPTFYQVPAVKSTRRNGSARAIAPAQSTGNYHTAPRQMRTSGILDQLAEQYALPESRSIETHNVSFGSDS